MNHEGRPSRLLVTGGAGFIGGNFVLDAVGVRGQQVLNVDALTYAGNLDTLADVARLPNHRFVHADIADYARMRELLAEFQPDAVLNFAAESHVDRSIDGPDAFVQTNVVGTLKLLRAALDYYQQQPEPARSRFRFLHVSTDEVYGSLGAEGRFSETTPYQPNSPYSASKAASDHLVRAFFHTYGLPVLTTNCSNNYGPYQFPEKLIPLMILKAEAGEPLPVYGNGSNVRDWLHVSDHVEALQRVLAGGRVGEVYNIGGDAERSNLEVVHAICDALDARAPRAESRRALVRFVKDRPGHDQRYAIDASKIKGELGWSPRLDFASGLDQTIDWYLRHPHWVERIRSGGYRGERLGLSAA